MQGVDHGLCLIEADGVGRQRLYDRGECLLDGPRTVDVRKCLQIEAWVAGTRCARSGLTAGTVIVAIVLAAERGAAALMIVRHDVVALGNHVPSWLGPTPGRVGVAKSLRRFSLCF